LALRTVAPCCQAMAASSIASTASPTRRRCSFTSCGISISRAVRILRHLFFLLVVRPFALFLLGVNVRHGDRLPSAGPALVVANHNSHLDTLVLMTLFPQRLLDRLRPVAASDYFLKQRALAWFALGIIGIIPLAREVRAGRGDPLAGCNAALAA